MVCVCVCVCVCVWTHSFDGRHEFVSCDGLLVGDESHCSLQDSQHCIVRLGLLTQDLK